MSVAGKWGYSTDEEMYYGHYDTAEEAAREAAYETEVGPRVMVGQYRDPVQPEECFDCEDLFERVWCHDDYSGEWAEGCLSCTREQQRELEQEVSKVMAAWLDKHDLRPKFGIVDKFIEMDVPEN